MTTRGKSLTVGSVFLLVILSFGVVKALPEDVIQFGVFAPFSQYNFLHAYDADTGMIKQSSPTPAQLTAATAVTPDGSTLYAAFHNGEFRKYAIAFDGTLLPNPVVITGIGDPAYAIHIGEDGRVWVSSQGSKTLAIVENDAVVHTTQLPFTPIFAMTSDADNIYVGGFGELGIVRASDGQVLRVVDFPGLSGALAMVTVQGKVYAPFGDLFVYDPATDAIVEVPGTHFAGNVVTDGCAVYPSQSFAYSRSGDPELNEAHVWKVHGTQVLNSTTVPIPQGLNEFFISDGLALRQGILLIPDRNQMKLNRVHKNTLAAVGAPFNLPVGGAVFGPQSVLPGIAPFNTPPIAYAGIDQHVSLGATVQLDGSTSCDGDGDSLTFSWTFLSKPAGSNATLTGASTPIAEFVPDRIGTYTVKLVLDDGEETASDTVVITTATVEEAINDLIDAVNALVNSGSLNTGQGNSLIVKLENALDSLASGKIKTAKNQLQTFINEVEDMIVQGVLSESEGRPLIQAATAIRNAI